MFTRLAAPRLLLDGLARTRALRPPPGDVRDVEVPRHIARVEWFTDDDDLELVRRHPDGVRLRWDAGSDTFPAVAPGGAVIEGVRGASMGRVLAARHAATTTNSEPR